MFSNKEEFKQSFIKKLEMTYGKSFEETSNEDRFQTLGQMVREHISENWIRTNELYRSSKTKQIYYFSIEFLLGRLLSSNLLNLGITGVAKDGLEELGISLAEIEEVEADAGLGNGGLGRLAACFLDSLAALNLPGHGSGIRYKHGLFEQKIVDGFQVELPEQWLRYGHVWEVRKSDLAVEVPFWGKVESYMENGRLNFRHVEAENVMAVPYDMPVVGYNTETVNTLRLWSAEPSPFPIHSDVLQYKKETETITEFLYPDDTHDEGKILRLKQQYFLVSASLHSIIRSFKKKFSHIGDLPEKIGIHINDTHPVLAIPELMRILMDEEKLGWEEAWDITVRTISYTNHTTLSEALEKWPIRIFKPLLPRIYLIVEEINERFCRHLWEQYPGDWRRIEDMAVIAHDQVKMAHIAIAGSFSVNGVAALHTEILKTREMKQFYEVFPEKFNNKTNGITHRRWLLKSNPELTQLINESIGDDWIKNPILLSELEAFRDDHSFAAKLMWIKQQKKQALAKRIEQQSGIKLNLDSIFDVQVKRLHAYKRQLLNVFHIIYLYNRIKEDSSFQPYPRTFIFGAKASPGYYYAKKIIKLINSTAELVNKDPKVNKYVQVVFLENYRVSLAEQIFPAADVSEQISTAGKEASGTGNMKFMMNGAITLGTLDGANVEILERVGDENMFIFGLKAEEVMRYYLNGDYRAREYYHHDKRIRQVVDQLVNGFFPNSFGQFEAIHDSLLAENDQYFVLRDFASYADAHEKVAEAYLDRDRWMKMSIINIAQSGYFTSDRTIQEYAEEIWNIDKVKMLH
ncbi:glycogen/starch/alpha-glucan phosphorylase [Peribacillus saganii]|uniref:Alpha-1,4 glucan phosphorylase n=1 Tax=Peribacillus saganii TaxID=2303992 RepID=A0A372LCI2_9BACI|nr:glycogen/starch/alpha-glucan phosphorylase [Peribacillus saganii]RFU63641.1 glycogen/starch/alpha-glucan phosphorylase [Peribacillus saganii]